MRRRAARSPAQTRFRTNTKQTRGDCFDAGALLPITQQSASGPGGQNAQLRWPGKTLFPPSREPTSKRVFTRAIGVRRASRSFQVFFFIFFYLFSSGPWCPALVRCKASARPPQIRCWSSDPSWFAAKQPRARVKIRMKNKRVGVPQGLRVSLSELLFGWRFVLDSQEASRLDPETKRQFPGISAFFSRRSRSVFSPRRPTMLKLFRKKKNNQTKLLQIRRVEIAG